ncbi:hypothetical protein [Kitasatospora sp. NPDC092286]|uniref:hypothetical protein n=1 Tax=Kitasatospora sp. NPDC092286 TaxID=3364087 RepID=UPI00382DB82A
MAPQIQADSRWISVDAGTRQAYMLSGKDRECTLLSWIARGPGREASDEFTTAVQHLGMTLDETGAAPAQDFLAFYRRLNLGYPFLDYSVEASHEVDRALMDGYAAHAGPPPATTPRSGPQTTLPKAELPVGQLAANAGVDLLAAWLGTAGRITGRREGRHGPIVLKTSPSGGARHPTDLGVLIGTGWPAELQGAWWYDGDRHTLVPAGSDIPMEAEVPPFGIAFVVSSHVQRAMWRYRDVRALRPVLIDAGHVVETLNMAVQATGWSTAWLPIPAFTGTDPILGLLLATPAPAEVSARPVPTTGSIAPADSEYRTNPFLSLVPAATGLYAQVHSEPVTLVALSPAAVTALAYANPSARGDRPSSLAHIRDQSGASQDELSVLVAARALVPATQAEALWTAAQPWINASWFPSLLVHADAACEARTTSHKASTSTSGGPLPWSALPAALAARRTSRSFTHQAVPARILDTLLPILRDSRCGVRLSLLLPCGNLDAGAYRKDGAGTLLRTGEAPSSEDIQRAAIGQPWTAGISLVVWLVPEQHGEGPAAWEESLIQCGRDAQRIAVALATDRSVGVFQSPALVDDLLVPLTDLDASVDGAYLVGVGALRSRMSTHSADGLEEGNVNG